MSLNTARLAFGLTGLRGSARPRSEYGSAFPSASLKIRIATLLERGGTSLLERGTRVALETRLQSYPPGEGYYLDSPRGVLGGFPRPLLWTLTVRRLPRSDTVSFRLLRRCTLKTLQRLRIRRDQLPFMRHRRLLPSTGNVGQAVLAAASEFGG